MVDISRRTKHPHIGDLIQQHRSHVLRPGWKKPRGRPSSRWTEQVKNDNSLGDDKWWLGLRWRQRVQEGNLQEPLNPQDEDIQIQRQDSSRDVDPPPRPRHAIDITRKDGDTEDDKGNDANDVRWQELGEGAKADI